MEFVSIFFLKVKYVLFKVDIFVFFRLMYVVVRWHFGVWILRCVGVNQRQRCKSFLSVCLVVKCVPFRVEMLVLDC